MSAPRVDYISILVSSSHDEAQRWIWQNVAQWVDAQKDKGVAPAGGWKPTKQFNPRTSGNQYYVEMWGTLSWKWLMMNYWTIQGKLVTRLDVRYEVESASAEGLGAFVAAAASAQKGTRNVQTFNGRPRKGKSGSRTAGGVGLAIGSHKSDKRVTMYQKPGEPVAVECQLQGDFLAKLWGDFVGFGDTGVTFDKEIEALMDQCTYMADQWLAQSVGIDPAQLLPALQSPDGTYLTWEGQLSGERVVALYEKLDPQAKRDVRARLAQLG